MKKSKPETITSGRYKHYKGGEVEVLFVAYHTETVEPLVIYRALYDCRTFGKGSLWARPLSMFKGWLEIEGKKKKRFEKI